MRRDRCWEIKSRSDFKTDFLFSEVGKFSLPLGLAIDHQLVRGFSLPPDASILHFVGSKIQNTEILFSQWPEISFAEAAGLVHSPAFEGLFDESLFFEKLRQGRGTPHRAGGQRRGP